MKIEISNVYNTLSQEKTIKELTKLAKKHIEEIIKEIKEIDKNDNTIIQLYSFGREVNWEELKRGEDYRFSIKLYKKGRGRLTAKKVYYIANSICLRPCYFNNY